MPNSPSAKKRLRQNVTRRGRNRAARTALRSQVRRVRAAIAAGDAETCEKEFRLAAEKFDRAASKRLIHPNVAARSKSRLSAQIKAVKTAT